MLAWTRRLDRVTVAATAALHRGPSRSAAAALDDLLGWERFEARRAVPLALTPDARRAASGAAR
ncbi:hypothetical protein BJF78_32185 [Pseudonocardia sp. CNS-139]|nr:hypothetical protein BJF78_32185 [Pseudonocardia sp. CNS-139]